MKRTPLVKLILVSLWLLLTVSMVSWWFYLAFQLVSENISEDVARKQRMLVWEGSIFLLLIVLAAVAMFYFMLLESRRSQQVREFFAAFSHDLKTSLTSLRLQIEGIMEDSERGQVTGISSKALSAIMSDSQRLNLQLENSLFVASEKKSSLYFESLQLAPLLQRLQLGWPQIAVEIKGDALIRGDTRALESIFSNLLHNSIQHGRASRITIQMEEKRDRIFIHVCDNGRGFNGDVKKLGHAFLRPTSSSGSGVGLFIVRTLAERLNGTAEIHASQNGFCVLLSFSASRI